MILNILLGFALFFLVALMGCVLVMVIKIMWDEWRDR